MNGVQIIIVAAIRAYRVAISPVLTVLSGPFGLGCRFTPTCSEYALEAVKTRGALHGSLLAAHRLCRCHPWGGSGFDPVPSPGLRATSPEQATGPKRGKALSNGRTGALDQKLSG